MSEIPTQEKHMKTHGIKRKTVMSRMLPIVALALTPHAVHAKAEDVTAYQTPACGCCTSWVGHLQKNGFNITARVLSDISPVKDKYRVPVALRSCHTSVVGGYVIEGHVPADTIKRLLRERPLAAGLAAPGMPQSAPGMDNPGQPYEVIIFGSFGQGKVYERR
jgi:hypothetical protein